MQNSQLKFGDTDILFSLFLEFLEEVNPPANHRNNECSNRRIKTAVPFSRRCVHILVEEISTYKQTDQSN